MIIEINYTALQWDNYQGGSGIPITGRLLRTVDSEATLAELDNYADDELNKERSKTKMLIGDYLLINIVIDK